MAINYKSDILVVPTVSSLFNLKINDNQLVQTQGYSTEGVGANLYRYDAGSSATINGGFILPGLGGTLSFSGTIFNGTAGTGRFIAVDQTIADVDKYGADPSGVSVSTSAFNRSVATGRQLQLGVGLYVVSEVTLNGNTVIGCGTEATTVKAASGASYVLRLGRFVNGTYDWAPKVLRSFTVDGNSKASDGITWGASSAPELSLGWMLESMNVVNCNRGLYKQYGNIGNTYDKIQLRGCNYGMYAKGYQTSPMHVGNDTWRDGEINTCSIAAIYYDGTTELGLQSGGLSFENVIIEGNAGAGIYLRGFRDRTAPAKLTSVWFEANTTSPTVTIDSVLTTTRDVIVDNSYAKIVDCSIPSMELVNSNVLTDYCKLPERADAATAAKLVVDVASQLKITNARITNLHQAPILIESIATNLFRDGIDITPVGNVTPTFRAQHRLSVQNSAPAGGVLESSNHFDTSTAVAWGAVTSAPVADGLTKRVCAELVIGSGVTANSYSPAALKYTVTTAESASWFVITGGIKCVGSDPTTNGLVVAITGDNGQSEQYQIQTVQDEWTTVASLGFGSDTTSGGGSPSGACGLYLINGGGSTITVRVADWQAVRFAKLADALAFLNSRQFCINDARPVELYGTGSPEGVVTAIVGSRFYRTDGGTNTTLYVKESGTGNTGWVAK